MFSEEEKKIIIDSSLKKQLFSPTSTPSSAENKLKKDLLPKYALAHYLAYAALATYVPVLGDMLCHFPCGTVFINNCWRRIKNQNWTTNKQLTKKRKLLQISR